MNRQLSINRLMRNNSRREVGLKKDSDSGGNDEKNAKVSFGNVRIHTHDITLSFNPAVSSGLPMELQWDHIQSENFNIEDYEAMGGGTNKKPLRVSKMERERRLAANGHSRNSFSECFREILKIKEARNQTIREVKEEKYRRRAKSAKEAAKAAAEKTKTENEKELEQSNGEQKSNLKKQPQGNEGSATFQSIQETPAGSSPQPKVESLKNTKSNSSLGSTSCDRIPRRMFGIKISKSRRLQM